MTRREGEETHARSGVEEPEARDSITGTMTLASVLDLEVLQELQDALAAATSMAWELVDPDGYPLTRPSGARRICELVRSSPSERMNCVQETSRAGREACESAAPREHTCETCGMLCIAAPVKVAGIHLASWNCGQVRLDKVNPALFARLEEATGLSRETIASLHAQVPVVSRPQLAALASLAWQYARGLSAQGEMNLQLQRDVAARGRAEAFLDEIINAIGDPIFVKDELHRWVACNEAFCKWMGQQRERLVGKSDFEFFPEHEARTFWEKDDEVLSTGKANVNEEPFTDAAGTTRTIVTTKTVLHRPDGTKYLVGIIRDITLQRTNEEELAKYRSQLEELVAARTRELVDANLKLQQEVDERRRAEEGKLQAEAQLVHQQKLEAVGRLAGGVAHDFNNLLTGILGHVSLAMKEAPPEGRVFDSLGEIRSAARRAADLTRQLLAFSRKQLIEPRRVDLNLLLGNLHKLLARIIGEDVHLELDLQPDLSSVRVDPGQIEQVIVNLAVNARDAMPGGGALSLRTSRETIASPADPGHPGVRAGDYVVLTVRDGGTGMDGETRDRIFEPFFTTKQHGTGLGLSTVYGIVRQHEGFIEVESSPGAGSTFKVYLPAVQGEAEVDSKAQVPTELAHGNETILLVEDEAIVRDVARMLLSQLGYDVLLASDGPSALALSGSHAERIHLLITDIVMPGMDGRQLASALQALRPQLRVLFTSGYADDVVFRRGVLEKGMNFLAKPFSREVLAARVREILDRP